MNWKWTDELGQHVNTVLTDTELGYMIDKPEEFLDASTGVDHIRNFVIFYHDGVQFHLTLEAEYKRAQWLRAQSASFCY